MQETFEHNISQQLGNYKLQPSPTVWQAVDAALHPERKPKLLIWWWLPLLGLLVSGLGYWLFTNISNTKNHIILSTKSIISPLAKPTTDSLKVATITINIEAEKQKMEHYPVITSKLKLLTVNKQQHTVISTNKITTNKIIVTNNNSTGNTRLVTKYNPTITTIITVDTVTSNNEPIEPIAATNIKDSIILARNSVTDTLSTAKITTKQATKKHQWLIRVGGGLLNISQNNSSNGTASSNNTAVSLPGVGSGVGAGTSNTSNILPAHTGFNFNIGIDYQTQLSKKWQLTTGLQYQYLQNKQSVGNDSAGIFSGGKNSVKTNNAHFLHVPVSFTFITNQSARTQLGITIGGSLARAFSEQWLISNSSSNLLYYNSALNNKWLLGLHGGLSFYKPSFYKITVLTSYSVTPIYQTSQTKYHFLLYSVQLSTPITFKHSSSTKK